MSSCAQYSCPWLLEYTVAGVMFSLFPSLSSDFIVMQFQWVWFCPVCWHSETKADFKSVVEIFSRGQRVLSRQSAPVGDGDHFPQGRQSLWDVGMPVVWWVLIFCLVLTCSPQMSKTNAVRNVLDWAAPRIYGTSSEVDHKSYTAVIIEDVCSSLSQPCASHNKYLKLRPDREWWSITWPSLAYPQWWPEESRAG